MEKDWFWHQHNIEAKTQDKDSNKYKQYKDKFKDFLKNMYNPFSKSQMEIKGIEKQDIQNKLRLLEKYYKKIDNYIKTFPTAERSNLRSRAKLRSTIIEEFCGYLFKDIPEIKKLGLGFYNKGIFAGLSVDEHGKTQIKTKDVDFCIGKEINAEIERNKQVFIIPIIAIECKTYTDKTMFSEAQFTAQTIKRGSPNVKVYVVSETNQMALEEIPSQTPIDQYYVLRGAENKPISLDVLMDFFNEIRETIKKTTEIKIRKLPGKLIIS